MCADFINFETDRYCRRLLQRGEINMRYSPRDDTLNRGGQLDLPQRTKARRAPVPV